MKKKMKWKIYYFSIFDIYLKHKLYCISIFVIKKYEISFIFNNIHD